jgi:hypothetical protein
VGLRAVRTERLWVYSQYSVRLGQKSRGTPKKDPLEVPRRTVRVLQRARQARRLLSETLTRPIDGDAHLIGRLQRWPLFEWDVPTHVITGQYVGSEYHRTYVRSDPSYAKVFFNTIMYYVLENPLSEKTSPVSQRDKREHHRTTDTGQYYVLRSIRKICKRTRLG